MKTFYICGYLDLGTQPTEGDATIYHEELILLAFLCVNSFGKSHF